MKQFRHKLDNLLITIVILSLLLVAGCIPIQPATSGTPGEGTIPGDQGTAVQLVTWEGAPLGGSPTCAHLTVESNERATFGACDKVDQSATLAETHQRELGELQRRLAPFTAETPIGTVTFNGMGASDSAAWQRAVAAWARLVYSELASGAVSATGATIMHWTTGPATEQPEICNQLTILVYGYAYADTVPCGGGEVIASKGGWLNDAQMAQIDHWLTDFAPVYVENNYLAGNGAKEAHAAWQRTIDAWAQLVSGEVSTGRVSAAGATAMSWFIDPAAVTGDLCQHLTVLTFGYAYAEITPCAGGVTIQSAGGPLTDEELTQLDGWLYDRAALYVENNYLAGVGETPITDDEVAAVEAWATVLYNRLQGSNDVAGGEMDLTTWTAYTADSGFVIYYPSTLYTVSVLEGSANSPFSGAIVLTPTAALNSRTPAANTYKLAILAHVASKAYSLTHSAPLLANGQYLSYAPTVLEGHPIVQTRLAGAPAVRVEDLPVGQAGITMQIVAIRADIAYELVVEPSQVGNGDTAADQANRELVEQMINTLRFVR